MVSPLGRMAFPPFADACNPLLLKVWSPRILNLLDKVWSEPSLLSIRFLLTSTCGGDISQYSVGTGHCNISVARQLDQDRRA